MANPEENTSYRGSQVLIGWQSDLSGNTLSKAVDISAFVTALTVTETPQTKDIMPVSNNGQQSATITGSTKVNGNISMSTPRALLSMLIRGTMGRPTTSQALTADTWASTTVTLKGDVVKLSGGKYLVAQNAGTTGSTEPTVVGVTDYQDLATLDGTVKWKLRDNLYERLQHKTGFCTDKLIIIQRIGEGCGSSNKFDRILENVDITSFLISKQDGGVAADQSIPFLAESVRRSTQDNFVDVTVTSTITVREDYYLNDNITILVDGARYGTLLNFDLTYTRNVTQLDGTVPGESVTSSDAPTFTGNGTIRLSPSEYEKLLKTDMKSITITFNGNDGETALFTMPKTQFHTPAENVSGSREIWMDFQVKPVGTSTSPMATVDITTATNM